MEVALRRFGFSLLAVPLLLLSACGDPKLSEAPSTSAFAAATIAITQTGNAPVTVEPGSTSFKLDDARTLQGSLHLTSQSAGSVTVIVRVSLYNSTGGIIGDATGGQVNVMPGVSTTVPLTGPAPIGTISAATIEVSIPPSTSPTIGGGPTPVAQLPMPT